MAKNKTENPTIQLPQIIDELTLINGKIFQLKLGVKALLTAITEKATQDRLEKIVQVYHLSDILDALETKF